MFDETPKMWKTKEKYAHRHIYKCQSPYSRKRFLVVIKLCIALSCQVFIRCYLIKLNRVLFPFSMHVFFVPRYTNCGCITVTMLYCKFVLCKKKAELKWIKTKIDFLHLIHFLLPQMLFPNFFFLDVHKFVNVVRYAQMSIHLFAVFTMKL